MKKLGEQECKFMSARVERCVLRWWCKNKKVGGDQIGFAMGLSGLNLGSDNFKAMM